MNFPFICSNIPAAPAYGVYNISQLIRYSRACGAYQDFLDRGLLQTRKILNQGFLLVKLKSSQSFTVATMTWLTIMDICVTNDYGYVPHVVRSSRSFPHSWPITGFVTRLTWRVSLVKPELPTLAFSEVRVTRSLVLCVCFVVRCLSFCIFFFWPLCFLFFFDIRILITSFVSSNSSYYTQNKHKHIFVDSRLIYHNFRTVITTRV